MGYIARIAIHHSDEHGRLRLAAGDPVPEDRISEDDLARLIRNGHVEAEDDGAAPATAAEPFPHAATANVDDYLTGVERVARGMPAEEALDYIAQAQAFEDGREGGPRKGVVAGLDELEQRAREAAS